MKITTKIKEILLSYESDTPGVKANIFKVLASGKLAGTGKMVILPVDQGFEHGPERSFAMNPDAYDPHYHFQLAIDAGLSAFAAPLGVLEAGANTFAGQIPLILKMNSSNSLLSDEEEADQATTSCVDDAIRLGCCAIGLTIYPASGNSLQMFEETSSIIEEAKSKGLFTVVWSYPRGGDLSKEHETAADVISYGAHMACLLGAHFVKVKPPRELIQSDKAQGAFDKGDISIKSLSDRVKLVKRSAFNGRRVVIFSGGEAKSDSELLAEISQIAEGGGNGSIIGRNAFQRPRKEALELLSKVIEIYKSAS